MLLKIANLRESVAEWWDWNKSDVLKFIPVIIMTLIMYTVVIAFPMYHFGKMYNMAPAYGISRWYFLAAWLYYSLVSMLCIKHPKYSIIMDALDNTKARANILFIFAFGPINLPRYLSYRFFNWLQGRQLYRDEDGEVKYKYSDVTPFKRLKRKWINLRKDYRYDGITA